MKKIITLFTICISSLSIFAQPDSLLKKFKYRIDNYRAITLNGSGGSQYSQADLPADTRKNNGASGSLSGGYYFTKSTNEIQLTINTNLTGNLYRSTSKDKTNSNTSKNFSSGAVFSILNRWFYKKIFTELGADISGNFYSSKDINQTYPAAAKGNNTTYYTTVFMGIGKGRLENVTDMQNALWLYKELVNVQRLSGTLSASDLIELGQSITKGNNTRVLDARKRTQFLLTAVDNYLQQKGLISKTDITYFSNLNDILFYAYNNSRFAGTEKFIRFTPAAIGTGNNQFQPNGTDKSKHNFNTQTALLSVGYKKYNPSSLTHQNNYGVALNFSYTNADLNDRYFTNNIITSEIKGNTIIKKAGGNIFYEHAIYPNTRTNINFNLQADLGYQDADNRNFYTASYLSCTVNYFISYHTRLTAGVGASYQKNAYNITNYVELLPDSFQLYANAGIQISL